MRTSLYFLSVLAFGTVTALAQVKSVYKFHYKRTVAAIPSTFSFNNQPKELSGLSAINVSCSYYDSSQPGPECFRLTSNSLDTFFISDTFGQINATLPAGKYSVSLPCTFSKLPKGSVISLNSDKLTNIHVVFGNGSTIINISCKRKMSKSELISIEQDFSKNNTQNNGLFKDKTCWCSIEI